MKIGFVLILAILNLEVMISAATETATMNNMDAMNSGFDIRGTVTNVLSPSSIVINNYIVNLEGVDSSGLYRSSYSYLMRDLKDYYIGKDVFVKSNYVYLDLQGAYNSESLNEIIQKEILSLRDQQDYGPFYQSYYESSLSSSYQSSQY